MGIVQPFAGGDYGRFCHRNSAEGSYLRTGQRTLRPSPILAKYSSVLRVLTPHQDTVRKHARKQKVNCCSLLPLHL
jgi:hypothetical protein